MKNAIPGVRGVIFDMDGVLVDSEWFIAEAARLMFSETYGVAVNHEDFRPFIGFGENRFIGGVAEKYGIASFSPERDKARTYGIYTTLIKGKLRALPGAVEFVRRCRALGLLTALATSADYVKMMANLTEIGLAGPAAPVETAPPEAESGTNPAEAMPGKAAGTEKPGWSGFFEACVNGLEVERRKPFPDIFLEASRRLAVPPGYCWVVEDSLGGIRAAKAAGMRCLGLLTSFPEEDIRNAGADLVVQDLSFIEPEALGRVPETSAR
jgi:beta-phosphoglucomutase-like phosphatase (HAD superfamily)